MKRFAKGMALAIVGVFAVTSAMAAAVSSTVNVSAEVRDDLTMSVKLFKNDITGANISAGGKMDFGELVDTGTGTLRSSATSTTGTGAVLAYITVNSHGHPWTLKQTGTDLTSGGVTLERGSLAVKPIYLGVDNNGNPDDGLVGSAGTWAAVDKTLYASSAAGKMRTIRAYYSITDDPAAGASAPAIPLDKIAGSYTGTVTFTATT